jgi:hypothetical protein
MNTVLKAPIEIVAPATDTAIPENLFADLSKLRISQEFVEEAGVKKHLATVPIRKPHRHAWFRVHPAHCETFGLIQLGTEKEFYLVTPAMKAVVPTEVSPYQIFYYVTRENTPALWPVRLPAADGKDNEWWRSAREAAAKAMGVWTRIMADIELGAYQIMTADSLAIEPVWPDEPFNKVVEIAFRDRVINRPDHEVIRKLAGLI